MHRCKITPSYMELRSLYIGAAARKDENFRTGTVTLSLAADPDFSIDGTMNAAGYLSGMAKLYKKLSLLDGAELDFEFNAPGSIVVHNELPAAPVAAEPLPETVFQKQKMKHIYIEPFRPENLNTWEPATETDIYLAFGVLQDYTDYQYCCGASKAVLDKLGATYEGTAKPDAILIDRLSDEYIMAEWKKYSSEFKDNHNPEDVDLLVCWTDNEKDRDKLPTKVLALHTIARTAAETTLADAG